MHETMPMRWLALLVALVAAGMVSSNCPAAPATSSSDPGAARAAQLAADAARATMERSSAAATAPAFAIELGLPNRVKASMAFVASAPRMQVGEWIIIGPLPPELPGQQNVKFEATPGAATAQDMTELHRPLLLWRIKAADPAKRVIALGVEYSMELVPRLLVPAAGGHPAGGAGTPAASGASTRPTLTAAERQAFTASNTWCDFEAPAFQAWLAEKSLRPTGKETDLELARRVFLFIKQNGGFEFKPGMERRSSVVCKSIKSDCGGLTALYVSILRANGIPARQMIGRWAITAKDQKLDGQEWQQEHIKTEFFASGIGWVPVDVSVGVELDKKPDSLHHFGRDDGDFVTLHADLDLRVETVHFGKQSIQFMQEPAYWVKGTGSMQGSTTKFDWQVEFTRGAGGGPRGRRP